MATKGLLAVVLSGVFAPVVADPVDQYPLKIDRQPVVQVLRELSKQTGLQIVGMFSTTQSEGARLLGPLRGEFTAEQALQLLLVESDLTFIRVNANTITVTSKSAVRTDQRSVRTPATGADSSDGYVETTVIDAKTSGPKTNL